MRGQIGSVKERLVGWLLVGGLSITIISGFLMWMFSVSGIYRGTYTRKPITNEITDAGTLNLVPLTILGIFLGVVMMFAAIGYGFFTMAKSKTGARRIEQNFRVLARYCYDRSHNLVLVEYDLDAVEDPKFYIKAVLENGKVGEFETSVEVYFNAGEGMVGEAELQGQWLGKFIPYIGAASQPAQS